jgi:membrane protease YdiL (CAAX protease family)
MPTDDRLIPAGDDPFASDVSADDNAKHAEQVEPPSSTTEAAITSSPPIVNESPPSVLPVPRKPHPGFWWALLWCLGYLIVTQLIPGLVVPIIILIADVSSAPTLKDGMEQLRNPEAVEDLQKRSLLPMLIQAEVLGVVVSWLVIRLMIGKDWQRRLALRRPAVLHVLLVLLGLPALIVVANVAYLQFQEWIPGFKRLGLPDISHVMEQTRYWPWQVTVLAIGLGPGICEELWCRGFLGQGLVGRYGVLLGVLLTSFFFGLIHVDPPHAAIAACLGVVLHFVYLTSRSLWLPMLLHFLNNSLAVLSFSRELPRNIAFDTLKTAMAVLDPSDTDPAVEVLAAGTVVLGVIAAALYQTRARIAPADASSQAIWQPAYPGVEYPPPGSGAVVVCPRLRLELAALVLISIAGFWEMVYMAYLKQQFR